MDNRRPERVAQSMIVGSPLVVLLFFSYVKFYAAPHWYAWLVREDGHIENATCLLYLAACAAAGALAYASRKRGEKLRGALLLATALGFFFIAMEEISWGQRILQVETPAALARHNLQQELNVHNLLSGRALHLLYIAVGFYGAFSGLLLPKTVRLRLGALADLLIVNASLSLYFFPTVLFYSYWEVFRRSGGPAAAGGIGGRLLHARDQELVELLLAAGFFLHVSLQKRRRPRAGHVPVPALAPALDAALNLKEVRHDR